MSKSSQLSQHGHTKPQILQLDERALQKELEAIAAESNTSGPRPYTTKEDFVLISLYHKTSLKRLGTLLGRSIDSVQKRATRLGLTGMEPKK